MPGAKLSVIDADGKLVESWISEAGKTHMIERLPVGKYTLREESALSDAHLSHPFLRKKIS